MLDAPALHTISLPPRFALRAYLGAGGFGSVWLVYDREREAMVALKMMREWQPRALHRFKQEFRGLAGLVHPNLVTLYELVAEEPLCFFTMEFVQGQHFLSYVRPGHHSEAATALGDVISDGFLSGEDEALLRQTSPELVAAVGLLDEERLRMALWQLVEGVEALHEAGRLHRDIKPSNVMVTPEGRLVLLDFGLVTPRTGELPFGQLEEGGAGIGQFVGTPQYMSPEQAMGHEVGPATDWYSVGAMLYEALCGQPPIVGVTPLQVLLRKQSQEPAPIWQVRPDVPADLAVACMALLRRDPQSRAGGAELRALLAPRRVVVAPVRQPLAARHAPLVGRATQLRLMHAEATRLGGEEVSFVMVRGRSGMGKSLLARTFLRQLAEARPEALILEGRCYEHEAVPYKALDGLVELLCGYLERQRTPQVRALLQEVLAPLVQLFPTAARLGPVHGLALEEAGASDSEQRRLQGFEALRTLLAGLGRERPLVLYVDDVQWGDEDSAALLDHLLHGPAPSLLFVMAWRSEDEERSSFVRALRGLVTRPGRGVRVSEVEVDRLSEGESRQLVRSLFGHTWMDDALLERVTREAEGSPFMLDELARYVKAVGDVSAPRSIGAMIAARVGELPEGARRLLGVVAVAGQPVERGLARHVAALEGDEPAVVARLRNELMVRVTVARQAEALEIYHDRIRVAVLEGMEVEALRGAHLRLAEALEERGADGEVIARHYIGAGMEARAVQHVLHAAEQAAEALAFERAARLYAQALGLGTSWGDTIKRALITQLGEMYGYLGRGREAADAYKQAVSLAMGRQAEELERRAAEQLLRSGCYGEGSALLDRLLEQAGLRRAPTGSRLQAETLALRARLAWQGSAVRLSREEVEEEERWQLELCWTAAQLLSATNMRLGAYFGAQHLLLARRSGDAGHLSLSLSLEAMNSAGSEAGRVRAGELLAQAQALAPLASAPYTIGFVTFAQGAVQYSAGRWREAERHYKAALEVLRRECRGVAWEIAGMQLYQFMASEWRGDLMSFVDGLPALLDESNRRQDGYHGAAYRLWSFRTHLTLDAPHRARKAIEEALSMLPSDTFLLHHFWSFYASVNTALYEDQSARAWTLCMEYWPQLKGAQLLGHELLGGQALELRGRSAVGSAAVLGLSEGTRRKLSQEAQACAERLSRVGQGWAQGCAVLIEAQLLWLEGDRAGTIRLLQRGEEALEGSGTLLYLYASRMWRGQLLGGRGGALLVEEARRWMREQAIRSADRTLGMLLPASRVAVS